MRIVYTVCGDGLGHAFRSSIVIDHLLRENHQLTILASGKAFDVLSKKYQSVTKITGLKLIYQDNRVKRGKTIIGYMTQVKSLPRNILTIRKMMKNFEPQVVISDFEPAASLISAFYNIPLISIDNNHIICDTRFKVERADYTYYLVTRLFIDSLLPSRDYSLITTFFYPPLKKKHQKFCYLTPPLIRDEVKAVRPTIGDHILVYQTSDTYKELLNVLKNSDQKYIIYNGNREIKADNLVFRDFDAQQIIADMAGAKAVIANGGFTLISESLYLGKPVLSIPIKMQYEQILNGQMIDKLGLGRVTFRLSRGLLDDWLLNLPDYRKHIGQLKFDNNILFTKLDEILETIIRDK